MKRIGLVLVLLPTWAQAHAGDHSQTAGLTHALTEPDHAAAAVLVVLVAIVLLRWRMKQ